MIKKRKPLSAKTKRLVFERDHNRCMCCGCTEDEAKKRSPSIARAIRIEIDHIVPVWLGGSDDPSNLQLLCTYCHYAIKREEIVDFHKQFAVQMLYHPQRGAWFQAVQVA